MLAAIFGYPTICVILLCLGMYGIVSGYCAESPSPDTAERGVRTLRIVAATSVVLAGAIVILTLAFQPHHKALARTGAPSNNNRAAQRTSDKTDGYVSLILWPKQPRKITVVVPPAHSRAIALNWLSKPLVIPFDGAYWYLGSSTSTPGRDAHIEHGSPTEVDIHTTDWRPLIMKAHQRLTSPIDPRCCRELDLAILNADNRPGAIRIAVQLIDSTSSHMQSEVLGVRPVRSSMVPQFSLNRPPTSEVLKYAIPANPPIRQFNEIEVLFLPSKERSRGGSQIAIRNFQLLPAW